MNKHEIAIRQLHETGTTTMRCSGNSMLPVLSNPSICTYRKEEKYKVGHIVFCKVSGRYIDAHWVKQVDGERYMIANNRGRTNGWTRTIYGRVVRAQSESGSVKDF
jgi:hypothetical protein